MSLSFERTPVQAEQEEHLEAVLRSLFTDQARQLARETGFVQRRSPIDGAAFAQTMVFGFLDEPDASYTDLQQILAAQKVVVSPQAIEKRMKESAACFLHRMVESLLTVLLVGESCSLELLSGFKGVYLQDGTIIELPDALHEHWRGFTKDPQMGTRAGLRVQVRLELLHGQLQGPWLQPARADERSGPSSIEEHPLPAGCLYVTDSKHVTFARMRRHNEAGRYWLAPATLCYKVIDQQGLCWELPNLIATRVKQGHQVIDEPVRLGVQDRVPCRLIAVPNPAVKHPTPAQVDRRPRIKGSRHDVQIGRKKAFKSQTKCKHHRESPRRRELSHWIVLVTNVPASHLSAQQARELLRARWQEELLWKLWKQSNHLDVWRSEKPMRILCELYAKLIGVIVQHWFTLLGCWQDAHRRLVKASKAVKKLAVSVVLTLTGETLTLRSVVTRSQSLMQRCQLNPRFKHPNTSQHLIWASG